MDLDARRYMGTVTSPFHGNVQFDRHPTEGGSGFSALREYRNPSPMGQSRTREAQPPQVVWPERYRQVGYSNEEEKDVFKLKPRGRALTNTLEQMFREEAVPQV